MVMDKKSYYTVHGAYLQWLRQVCGCGEDSEFVDILNYLSFARFKAIIPNDDDRAEDGLKIRSEFQEYYDWPVPVGQATIMEVLLGLARHMAYIEYTPATDECDMVGVYFWEMIANLGIRIGMSEDDIRENILVPWLDRTSDVTPFPLYHPVKGDQRRVNLWYQMHAFIRQANPSLSLKTSHREFLEDNWGC